MAYLIYLGYSDDKKTIINELNTIEKYIGVKIKGSISVNNKKIKNEANVLGGDNESRDMSGYEKGLSYIIEKFNPLDDDLLIFINNTIFTKHYYKTEIKLFNKKIENIKNTKNYIIGWEDKNKQAKFNSIHGPQMRWVSTYQFGIPALLAKKYRIRPDYLSPRALFNMEDVSNFFSKKIPDELEIYIKKSIMTKGQGWINSENLDENSKERLAGKASAILCESELSHNIINGGGEILATNEAMELKNKVYIFISLIYVKYKAFMATTIKEKIYRAAVNLRKINKFIR
jgi:hypothetical protein